jgi:hypothetical protein
MIDAFSLRMGELLLNDAGGSQPSLTAGERER